MATVNNAMLLAIARNLREFGYPDVKPEVIREELSRPASERGIIGMFAAKMLEDHGITEFKFD